MIDLFTKVGYISFEASRLAIASKETSSIIVRNEMVYIELISIVRKRTIIYKKRDEPNVLPNCMNMARDRIGRSQ
jgi:hypothetical protein